MDPVAVVLGQADLDRGDGGYGAGQPDEPGRVERLRQLARARSSRASRTTPIGVGQLLWLRRVVMEELLGDAHAPEVDRHRSDRRVAPDDELGRAAADVDDQERTVGGVEV